MEVIEIEEEEQVTEDDQSTETTLSEKVRRQDIEKLRRMEDTDLESVEHTNGVSKLINISATHSVDSSVTMGQSREEEPAIEKEKGSTETSTTSSRRIINEEYFTNLFKEGMTMEEKEEIEKKQMSHLFRKFMADK